jgi:hypothetical protein
MRPSTLPKPQMTASAGGLSVEPDTPIWVPWIPTSK